MNKLHMFSSFTLASALTLTAGCAASDDAGATAGETTANATTSGGGATDEGQTGMNVTTAGGDTTAGTDPGTSDGTTATAGGTTAGPVDPLPDGSTCTENPECISEACFVVGGLGGICGECTSDADCDAGGCSLPNPITSAPSVCNMGELGGGCENSDACEKGLLCAVILDVPAFITAATCSECEDDSGCPAADETCQPTYDVPNISGEKTCVMTGSLPLGSGCDLDTGDAACMSGYCAEGSFMQFVSLGVCSDDCSAKGSCAADETCEPPQIDLAKGLIAGGCVPAA